VRASGVKGTVVELPQGGGEQARDLTLRVGTALHADAILIGLEPGGATLSGATMRVAHTVATSPEAGRVPKAVLVREGGGYADNGGVVAFGAWGGHDRDTLVASVRAALDGIGLKSAEQPLDATVREMAGRSIFGDVALVAITADAHALRASSLDTARRAARTFAVETIPSFDGSVGSVAARLAAMLPPPSTPFAPDDIVAIGRRAALEQSIVARRLLEAAVSETATRAALARAGNGEYLVVVGRDPSGVVVGAASTDPRAALPDGPRAVVKRLAECEATIAGGGSCHATEAL
jgi:hypothetical protein